MNNDKGDSFLQKGKNLLHIALDTQIEKAKGLIQSEVEKISLDYDPWAHGSEGHYSHKPSRVSYKLLDIISKRSSILSSIIVTRTNQVAAFSERQKTKYDLGYVIEPRDKDEEITSEQTQKIEQLYNFIENCGLKDYKPAKEEMCFDEFLRRITRDRLVYDQIAIEKVRSKSGDLIYFAPVDGSTIRHASRKEQGVADSTKTLATYDPKRDSKEVEAQDIEYAYVQVIDEVIQKAFVKEDLIFKMANVTNSVTSRGYSICEIELLISILTSHMNAETYHKKQFTQGHMQKGILHFKANISQRKLNMFKKGWYAQTGGGVQNSWRTPILAGMDEIKWIDLSQSAKDMEYHLWVEYCIKIMCAIYLIDPSEINFDISQGKTEGNPMFTSKNEHKLKQSKDRGLRPLLRFLADMINNILSEVDDNYVFKFVGLDVESKKDENDRYKTEIDTYKTPNEVRKENSLEPIDLTFTVGDKQINPYDLPGHPGMIQILNTLLGFESSANQGGEFPGGGSPIEGGGGGSPIEGGGGGEPGEEFLPGGEEQPGEQSPEMDEYSSDEEFGKAKKVKIEYYVVQDSILKKSLKGRTPTFSGHKLQGRTTFQGMEISIENKKGSKRSWKDPKTGETGFTLMKFDYGYIKNTLGADGDHVDVYMGPNKEAEKIYAVRQVRPDTRKLDEYKVMLGFSSKEEAKKAYLQHIPKEWFDNIFEFDIEVFKKKVLGKKTIELKKSKNKGLDKPPTSVGTKSSGSNIPRPTEDMIKFFKKRTGAHIKKVQDNMEYLSENSVVDSKELLERSKDHDKSKYSKYEMVYYIWVDDFYKRKKKDPTYDYPNKYKAEVKKATEHHVTNNLHHPEAHKDLNDMSDIDIAEMVCDWTAMSQELKQDNGSAKNWADTNIPAKWNFNKDRKDLIYELIEILDKRSEIEKSVKSEEEDKLIKKNKDSSEAKKSHKFKSAEWTHPNGHPRCLICGDEEIYGGICEGLEKSVRDEEILEKGRGLPVGTKRNWSGVDYIKHTDGWIQIGGKSHGKILNKEGKLVHGHEGSKSHKELADKHGDIPLEFFKKEREFLGTIEKKKHNKYNWEEIAYLGVDESGNRKYGVYGVIDTEEAQDHYMSDAVKKVLEDEDTPPYSFHVWNVISINKGDKWGDKDLVASSVYVSAKAAKEGLEEERHQGLTIDKNDPDYKADLKEMGINIKEDIDNKTKEKEVKLTPTQRKLIESQLKGYVYVGSGERVSTSSFNALIDKGIIVQDTREDRIRERGLLTEKGKKVQVEVEKEKEQSKKEKKDEAISFELKDALRYWTDDGFYSIKEVQDKGLKANAVDYDLGKKELDIIEGGFHTLDKYKGRVERGLKVEYDFISKLLDKYDNNKPYKIENLSSFTSKNTRGTSFHGKANLILIIENNKSGADISLYAEEKKKQEKEVLVPKNTEYKIKKIYEEVNYFSKDKEEELDEDDDRWLLDDHGDYKKGSQTVVILQEVEKEEKKND